ncbi:MAG: hypothetical protein GY906_23275 [bacterium]|nr:hypothetical protein [bacterium]
MAAPLDGHLTELDAINMILDTMGQESVNKVDSGLPMAELARRKLGLESRRIQAQAGGWAFNTRLGVVLQKNSVDQFLVPANTLFVAGSNGPRGAADNRPASDGFRLVSLRRDNAGGNFLVYDNTNNSETWPNLDTLTVHLVQVIPYEDCPPSFQYYIAASAAHRSQKGRLKSQKLAQFTQQDLSEWEANALNEDLDQMLQNPYLETVHGYFATFRQRNELWGGSGVA